MYSIREYRKNPDRLSDLLPWAALVGPGVILNKDGSFQKTLKFRGPDLDSATETELVSVSSRFNNALKRLGSGWAIFAEAQREISCNYPKSDFPGMLSAMIDEERRRGFEKNDHFESSYCLTLVYLPPSDVSNKLVSFFIENSNRVAVDYRAQLNLFTVEAGRLLDLIHGVIPEIRPLDDDETLTYLHNTISFKRHPVKTPEIPMYLDAVLADTPLVGGLEPRLGNTGFQSVSVLGYPGTGIPGILDAMNRLGVEYRWMTRYIPMDKEEAIKELTSYKRRWFSKRKGIFTLLKEIISGAESAMIDTDAENKAYDTDEALQELSNDDVSYGYTVLKGAELSTEDKALADRYEPGILIRFNGMKGAVRDNSMGRVVGFDRESNTVQLELDKSSLLRGYDGRLNSNVEASARDKQVISIDVARDFDKISAFREDRINISVGDEIRFTDNDKRLGVKNGHSGSVKSMDDDGNVTVYSHELKRDVVFSLHDNAGGETRYKHVALGYAVSTEGSQGMTRDFVIGALNVKPQPASNDLQVLIKESGADCTNRQFERWNRDLSKYESGYEKSVSLKDKGGNEWKATATVAVVDIAKNGEGPRYSKVVALRFDDYTVSHKGGEEIRNDLKEHGFWYNQTSGLWLTPVTSEKGMKFLGDDHPLKSSEYKNSIRSHLTELKAEAVRKEPCPTIRAPEAPSYGRYTYNAMNVILTRGRQHFDLVTNDKETLKKEIRNMARKESIQDYMAVQIPSRKEEIDPTRTQKFRREMGATLDRLMEKSAKIREEKGGSFEIQPRQQTPEPAGKGQVLQTQKQKSPDREMELSR